MRPVASVSVERQRQRPGLERAGPPPCGRAGRPRGSPPRSSGAAAAGPAPRCAGARSGRPCPSRSSRTRAPRAARTAARAPSTRGTAAPRPRAAARPGSAPSRRRSPPPREGAPAGARRRAGTAARRRPARSALPGAARSEADWGNFGCPPLRTPTLSRTGEGLCPDLISPSQIIGTSRAMAPVPVQPLQPLTGLTKDFAAPMGERALIRRCEACCCRYRARMGDALHSFST